MLNVAMLFLFSIYKVIIVSYASIISGGNSLGPVIYSFYLFIQTI